jgi:acid phosphatase (class A)
MGWVLALTVSGAIGQAATPSAQKSPKETRVVVIANTSAEADGLMAVLATADLRPPSLLAPLPAEKYVQPPSKPPAGLRGFYKTDSVTVEFWCVWELPSGGRPTDDTRNKVHLLPKVIRPPGKAAPAMVVAFGTAAGHWKTSYNGSVIVGSAVLLHSLRSLEDEDVTKALAGCGVKLDTIIESAKGWKFLEQADFFTGKRAEIEAKFLKPPLNPATDPVVLLSPNRLGLGSINVIDAGDYARADTETLDVALRAMSKSATTFEVGGVETTHGLIRAFSPKDAPFIYVTAVSNRLGYFPMELLPRRAAQHAAVVNNAGVVTAYLVDWILKHPTPLARPFHYLKADSIRVNAFPPPPACGSMTDLGDLNCVLWARDHRKGADINRARSEQGNFHFQLLADVLGPGFTEESLPKTATLLKNAIGDAENFSEMLKGKFRRPRPFMNHPDVHPVLDTDKLKNSWSYPSGHSTRGTTITLILARLIPPKADQLKQWACTYGWDRVIGGVHYPIDVCAGRDLGTMVVEKLLADEAFKKDLAACKDEIKKLNLPPVPERAAAGVR